MSSQMLRPYSECILSGKLFFGDHLGFEIAFDSHTLSHLPYSEGFPKGGMGHICSYKMLPF